MHPLFRVLTNFTSDYTATSNKSAFRTQENSSRVIIMIGTLIDESRNQKSK